MNQTYARLLGLFLIATMLRLLVTTAYRAAIEPNALSGLDFQAYYDAAVDLGNGRPLYSSQSDYRGAIKEGKRYVYPPLLAIALQPLARVDAGRAFHAWALLNALLLVVSVALFSWATRQDPWNNVVPTLVFCVTAFRFWPTVVELSIGQADLILLTLVSAMYVSERYELSWVTASLIVIAAMFKPWALALAFVLVVRRAWIPLLGSVVAFLGLLGVLLLSTGHTQYASYVTTLRAFAYQPTLVSHSIQGVARLLFGSDGAVRPIVPSLLLYWLFVLSGYVILVAGLGAVYRTWSPNGSIVARHLALDLAVVSILLGLTVCHMWYFVLILPIVWRLMAGDVFPQASYAKGVVGTVVYLLLSSPFPGVSPIPKIAQHGWRSLTVETPFYCAALLWVVVVVEAIRTAGWQSKRPLA